jgi:hypothetical protein
MRYAFLVAVVAWNGLALLLGILGLFRPEWRPNLAARCGQLARAAVGLSVAGLVAGGLGTLIAPEVAPAGIFFALVFWAFGGLLPFTVALFLRATRRDSDS